MQHLVRLSFADDETAGRSASCLETVFFYGGMTSLKIITFEQSTNEISIYGKVIFRSAVQPLVGVYSPSFVMTRRHPCSRKLQIFA